MCRGDTLGGVPGWTLGLGPCASPHLYHTSVLECWREPSTQRAHLGNLSQD